MIKDEYTKRLDETLREYIVLKTDDGQPYIYSNDQAITAILALNNEAIGEDELNPFGKPRLYPYSCDECGAPEEPYTRNQLRQELRNILGASNE